VLDHRVDSMLSLGYWLLRRLLELLALRLRSEQ
jgi:hypothetical protein